MPETQYSETLFAELYDAQPQSIFWMRPVFAGSGKSVIDFEYTYANEEGYKYLGLKPGEFKGRKVSDSSTLYKDPAYHACRRHEPGVSYWAKE
jgi:hypothetical protein